MYLQRAIMLPLHLLEEAIMLDEHPVRRINFFSGPGAGKSFTAAAVYCFLKQEHFDVELVREFIKEEMVYDGRFPQGYEQFWVMANQMRREEKALRHNKFIVTDCPILMNVAYAEKYNTPAVDHLFAIAARYELDYPSLNIVLNRDGIDYVSSGRYQNYEGALEMDDLIHALVKRPQSNIKRLDYAPTINFEMVLNKVSSHLGDWHKLPGDQWSSCSTAKWSLPESVKKFVEKFRSFAKQSA